MEWPMSGSGMTANEAQLAAFRAKVTRIEKRGPVMQIAPIGPADEQVRNSRKELRRARREAAAVKIPREKIRPVVFLTALVLGAAAVVAVRYGRAEWLTDMFPAALAGEKAGMTMLSDFGAALFLCLVIKVVLGARSRQFVAAQTIGAAVMVLAMHNLVHAAPDLWQMAFPQSWVNEVVATTEPHSILITGISFQL